MTLHIYAQSYNHDDSFIVGTKESLIALRENIDRALKKEEAHFEEFVADGEGYDVYVILADENSIEKLQFPYTEKEVDGIKKMWLIGGDLHPVELLK